MRRPEEISADVRRRGFAVPADVRELEQLATETNSPRAHVMVGDLIQLLEDTVEYELSDAEAAYVRAIQIDPTYAEGYASLGFFYDAVLDEPERARPFFEKAIALGDREAIAGLRSVLDQLGG